MVVGLSSTLGPLGTQASLDHSPNRDTGDCEVHRFDANEVGLSGLSNRCFDLPGLITCPGGANVQ